MNAIDTNILLYSVDRYEPLKQAKAQALLQTLRTAPEPTCLLWQVLGEVGQQLRRWREQGKLSHDDFHQHLHAFRNLFPVLVPVPATFDQAIELAERHQLSHWDSMLVAACQTAGISRLYTEDMGAPRMIEGTELINPFA